MTPIVTDRTRHKGIYPCNPEPTADNLQPHLQQNLRTSTHSTLQTPPANSARPPPPKRGAGGVEPGWGYRGSVQAIDRASGDKRISRRRAGALAGKPPPRDSAEVPRRGTEVLHGKPTRHPRSPNIHETRLDATSNADCIAVEHQADQHMQVDTTPRNQGLQCHAPIPAPRPTTPFGGVVAGGVPGY